MAFVIDYLAHESIYALDLHAAVQGCYVLSRQCTVDAEGAKVGTVAIEIDVGAATVTAGR